MPKHVFLYFLGMDSEREWGTRTEFLMLRNAERI